LLYTEVDPKTRANLWILADPLGKAGSSTPIPFLKTEFTESEAQFSPDGHWIAYTSDEAGQFEVYVRPYPAAAGEWKISKNIVPSRDGDGTARNCITWKEHRRDSG